MKEITGFVVLGVSLAATMSAYPETDEFARFDLDQDGTLSIEEAKKAFPAMLIIDVNNDGYLNRPEAAYAFDSLKLPPESSCQDDRVRAYEYEIIKQKLDENEDQLKQELSVMRKP